MDSKNPKKEKKHPDKKAKQTQIGVLAPGDKVVGPPHKFASTQAKDAFLNKILKPRGNTVYSNNSKTKKKSG